jgi:hypothetical protein
MAQFSSKYYRNASAFDADCTAILNPYLQDQHAGAAGLIQPGRVPSRHALRLKSEVDASLQVRAGIRSFYKYFIRIFTALTRDGFSGMITIKFQKEKKLDYLKPSAANNI